MILDVVRASSIALHGPNYDLTKVKLNTLGDIKDVWDFATVH